MAVEIKSISESLGEYIPERITVTPKQIKGFIYERPIRTKRQQLQFEEMVKSVKSSGVIEDIVVKRMEKPGEFFGIAGWMRYNAVKEVGLSRFTVIAYPADMSRAHMLLLALTENIVGVDSNPLDIAELMYQLKLETGWSSKTIAGMLGKGESWVSQRLQIHGNIALKEAVEEGEISVSQAEEIARIESIEQQRELVTRVKGTTVEETREVVREVLGKEAREIRIRELKEKITITEERIREAKKREDEKKVIKRKVLIAEAELRALESNVSENVRELAEGYREIEEDYFGSIKEIDEITAQLTTLEEEKLAVTITINELRKGEANLDKRELEINQKIESLEEELNTLREERKLVISDREEVKVKISEYDELEGRIAALKKHEKQAEERKMRVWHKRRGDIENFDNVKAAKERFDEDERQRTEQIRAKRHELEELNSQLRKFGGMSLERHKERLDSYNDELEELLARAEAEEKAEAVA